MACQNGSCGRCNCSGNRTDTTQDTQEIQLSPAATALLEKANAVNDQLSSTGVRIQEGDADAKFSDADFEAVKDFVDDAQTFIGDETNDPQERFAFQHVVGQLFTLFINTALKAGQRDKVTEKLGINIIDFDDADFAERVEAAIDGVTPAEA